MTKIDLSHCIDDGWYFWMKMKTRNENKPGYKKTKAGWIPQKWACVTLSKLIKNLHPGVSVNATETHSINGEPAVLKVSAVADGVFLPTENKIIQEKDIEKARGVPKAGDVIISRANTSELVGACGYVERDHNNLFLSDKLWRAEFDHENLCSPKWLISLLQLPINRHRINVRATGTSGSMKNISQTAFLSLQIATPSLPEQNKIAKILSTWDTAIEQTRTLITAKKNRKKALMQQLLMGKKRLTSFPQKSGENAYRFFNLPADWECMPMKKIARERSKRNRDNGKATVLSCSKHIGFIESSQYFGKQVYSEDTSNYKIIRRNWFGYPSNHIEEGSIGLLTKHEKGIVSPIYTVFECSEKILPEYLYAVFKTDTYRHIFSISTNSSVDRRGSLRWHAFSLIHVPIPGRNEQRAIVNVLAEADYDIDALNKKLKALEKQKRGLMQKLLTGEVRVKT